MALTGPCASNRAMPHSQRHPLWGACHRKKKHQSSPAEVQRCVQEELEGSGHQCTVASRRKETDRKHCRKASSQKGFWTSMHCCKPEKRNWQKMLQKSKLTKRILQQTNLRRQTDKQQYMYAIPVAGTVTPPTLVSSASGSAAQIKAA